MAFGKQRVRALYLAAQTGGWDADPSNSGAGYTAIRTPSEFAAPNVGVALLETSEATGRDRPTAGEVGPDSCELTFETPLLGLATAAGDGVAPSGTSALSLIMGNAFGAPQSVSGEGVSAGSSASTVALDTNSLSAGQLVCVQGSGTNSARAQWRRVTGATSPYTVAPADWVATPADADVAYGSFQWFDQAQGDLLSAVVEMQTGSGSTVRWLLLNGRVSALSAELTSGTRGKLTCTIRFDSKTDDTSDKVSLPAIAVASTPAIQGVLSPLWWGTSRIETRSIRVDWRVRAEDYDSTEGTNGRLGIELVQADPIVTIEPRYAPSVWETDLRAGTTRELLVQFGSGVVSGGVLNSLALSFPKGQVRPTRVLADGQQLRESVEIEARDNGASAKLWRLAGA